MKKTMMRLGMLCLTTLCLLLLSLTAMAEEAVSLTADAQSITVAVGKTRRLKVTVAPYAARRSGVNYVISDGSIAKVDAHGSVKGLAEGECTLTVISRYDETVMLSVPVRVIIPVRRLSVEIEPEKIHVGKTAAIAVSYAPEDASIQAATFTSSRESVATVDENGVITGVARGQADIAVHSADGYAKTRVRVRVLQQPTGLTLSHDTLSLTVGKSATLRATVSPGNADDKRVAWASGDESIATVNSRGVVKSIAPGMAVITATCEDDPSISASATVENVQSAKSVNFDQKAFSVVIGQTVQLSQTVLPENTTDQSVTYRVKDKRIATVDENGVVTGIRGGRTTVTVTTADGSRHHATATIVVTVPVTGVSFGHEGVRVGAGSYTYVTAALEPSDASNHHMTWEVSDPDIASVRGDTNKVRVSGRRWGRCKLTGTTQDGGYTVSIDLNVGSLRHAVRVEAIELRDGKPYIVLKNHSDMYITGVSYEITGTDEQRNTVPMSTRGDTLYGTYGYSLAPGQKTTHGRFSFNHPSNYPNLQSVSIAITGWETDTGYYTNAGELRYSYDISKNQLEWSTCETDYYKKIQSNPRAN